ncbi:Cytochrome b [Leminorella richardii]|uniref:Cytochrome b n=1 Tax=Leminorella richardii TaxID=158841 RepID=A0A2X4URN6_9GAMM|nr:cytochrome b/b6 domain-containing protein [Leminorella richardii]SQI42536.1 Cytochrome b [Leminorella richardii]
MAERKSPSALGHNPLGAIAIWLFWLLLPVVAFTGWAQDTSLIDRWPVEEWHLWLVNAVTALVCLHVLAVVGVSLWLRKNLIAAMLPGRR